MHPTTFHLIIMNRQVVLKTAAMSAAAVIGIGAFGVAGYVTGRDTAGRTHRVDGHGKMKHASPVRRYGTILECRPAGTAINPKVALLELVRLEKHGEIQLVCKFVQRDSTILY